ncbi:MAG: response regulator [Gammaproteobacteria bacterium]|nr:response regulator [Gammaproteobacteria bacterium]
MDVYKDLHFFPILVADDDPFQRRLVRHTLNSIGYKDIEEADSGLAALKMVKSADYSLIFTDVEMPGINGLELLRQIRCGNTRTPRDTRTVIFTSFSNMTVLRAAIALDVNGFLAKPLKTGDLLDNIRKAINETLHLKPESAYQSVNTDISEVHTAPSAPKLHITTSPKSTAKISTPIKQKPDETAAITLQVSSNVDSGAEEPPPDGAVKISLLQLKPGLVLMRNIVAKDSTLLLAAGSTLSQLVINRLQELRSMLVSEQIWVMAPDDISQDL